MIILGIDPSGNVKEGKGTTGFALILDDPRNKESRTWYISAEKYDKQTDYWTEILSAIMRMYNNYTELVIVCEDFLIYNNSSTLSHIETAQLIGNIKTICADLHIPLYMQAAVIVKKRWSNKILEHVGYIQKIGKTICDNNRNKINPHALDALRHAVHFVQCKLNK